MTNHKHTILRIKGFTIIELIVVISVIGILATITVLGYGNWRTNATTAQLKSDLNGAAAAMENARNFGNGYPLTVPTSFTPSSGVTLAGGGGADGKAYCLSAATAGIIYFVTDTNAAPQQGDCTVNGLVGWWKFNGNIVDTSGSNNNGVMNGAAALVTGQNGQANGAYSFNGTNDYVSTPSISLAKFTISAWIRPNGVQSEAAAVISDVYPSKVNYTMFFNPSSLVIQGGIFLGGWTYTPGASVVDGAWSLVTMTYSGSAMTLYVNGVLIGATPYSSVPSSSGTGLNIGRRWDLPNYFKGLIDDVRIYNRALSATEAQYLYAAGAQ